MAAVVAEVGHRSLHLHLESPLLATRGVEVEVSMSTQRTAALSRYHVGMVHRTAPLRKLPYRERCALRTTAEMQICGSLYGKGWTQGTACYDARHSEPHPVGQAPLAQCVFHSLLLRPQPEARLGGLRVRAPQGDRRPLPCCQRQACCAPQSHSRSAEWAVQVPDVAGQPCETREVQSCACHPADPHTSFTPANLLHGPWAVSCAPPHICLRKESEYLWRTAPAVSEATANEN